MPKRLTWDEMVKQYPEKWVVLSDVTYEDNDGVNIESAVVVQVISDEESTDIRLSNNRRGLPYVYRRTTEYNDFVGVVL